MSVVARVNPASWSKLSLCLTVSVTVVRMSVTNMSEYLLSMASCSVDEEFALSIICITVSLSAVVTPFIKLIVSISSVPVETFTVLILSAVAFATSISMRYFVEPLSMYELRA